MSDSPSTDLSAAAIERSRTVAGWPLLVAVGVWAVGLPLLPRLAAGQITGTATAVLVGLGVIAALVAAVVLLKSPTDPATPPFVGLGAVVATLLALAPLDRPAGTAPLAAFLLVAPWRYALTPLVVHFALETGWAHRRQQWTGWILGWYAVALGMLLVVTVGLVTNEAPLVSAVDLTFRTIVVEPIGAIVAVVAVAIALSMPLRGRLRRSLGWTIGAVVAGLGPLLLVDFIPALSMRLDGAITPARVALIALPVFGMAAVLTLPFRDSLSRDLAAHRLATALLEGPDLFPALRRIAETLHAVFGTRGVVIRLSDPDTVVAVGDTVPTAPGSPFAPTMEADDQHQELIAPIGRSANPLGEVRLEGRFTGAFGPTERAWLAAFLVPVADVLRARRRELSALRRNDALAHHLADSLDGLARAARDLPSASGDAGIALPPVVDAREVLAQLSDGVTGVARHGEGLAATATETRDCARGTSDSIARALDALSALNADMGRLARHGEDIAASNDTVSGVAFRTNLVANNAAIEATRAGTAGRTFGVLADEVRRLADTTAATSAAIGQRTAALASDVAGVGSALDAARHALAAAIREAEAGEAAAQRLNDAAAELEDAARSLRPAVAEANAVAKRRTVRDQHLTATMERFITERAALTRALQEHRDAIDRVARALAQLAPAG